MPTWLPWSEAMRVGLYGPEGFYLRSRPAEHFRTSAPSPVFGSAVATLIAIVDLALDQPSTVDFVDVGAGGGELLRHLAHQLPDRVQLVGVDLAGRPPGLPLRVEWQSEVPTDVAGVLLANEWLDNVPLDIAEVDASGAPRLVLVDPATGKERLAGEPARADMDWLDRWWPLNDSEVGTRAEIGRLRDEAWVACVANLSMGVAIAVDYDHVRSSRPIRGTLTGYRAGRLTDPVADGSCDLTAHVALDSCEAAVAASGTPGVVTRQRDVLRALGVHATRPEMVEGGDPAAYVRGLARASDAWLLTAVDGLGSFGWLAHAKGIAVPVELGG